MSLDALVSQLSEIGLTRNEGLAYLTLLEEDEEGTDQGLTGYEVATRSGIPRSAVYAVLRKLEQNGAAFCVGQRPARYLPVAPASFLTHVRSHTEHRLQQVAEGLERLPKRAMPEPVWILSRYSALLARAEAMIRGAQESVYLSLWGRELNQLRPAIESAVARGLLVVIYSVDRVAAVPAGVHAWVNGVDGDTGKASWSHRALIVIDRRSAMIGGTEPEADNQAVFTANPSLVDVATNHIILDITLLAGRLGRDCTEDVSRMMRPHFGPAA